MIQHKYLENISNIKHNIKRVQNTELDNTDRLNHAIRALKNAIKIADTIANTIEEIQSQINTKNT
jgi:hypothetical protein